MTTTTTTMAKAGTVVVKPRSSLQVEQQQVLVQQGLDPLADGSCFLGKRNLLPPVSNNSCDEEEQRLLDEVYANLTMRQDDEEEEEEDDDGHQQEPTMEDSFQLPVVDHHQRHQTRRELGRKALAPVEAHDLLNIQQKVGILYPELGLLS